MDLSEKSGPENIRTSSDEMMKESCVSVRLPRLFSHSFLEKKKRKRRENQTQEGSNGRKRESLKLDDLRQVKL